MFSLTSRQKGALTRFLGLDGAIGFEGVDFAQHWNGYLLTDDFVNANTGLFDPRHMFGTTNQGMLASCPLQTHTMASASILAE
jgi:hypothetical protein